MIRIKLVSPAGAHKNSRQNLYKRLQAKLGCFAAYSQKPRKRSNKKPTEQDLVSMLPNLDALRNDKEDAATAAKYKLNHETQEKKTESTKTNTLP